MSKADWVVAGGAAGESEHCQRCGGSLTIKMPLRIEVWLAAMKAFVKVHSDCRETERAEPAITLENWPESRDTGVSSATIFHVFAGKSVYGQSRDVPHDPSDFGRCYRLLKLTAEYQWRERLCEVSDQYPAWLPFVREWNRLTEMWEEALKTGNCKTMYEFMQTLREEAR
jgi:hypothetical protein